MTVDGGPWTTAEVVRLSGVTSRTLRHYDAIGLLVPAGNAPGGQRVYGAAELLRLQEILVLRELGVPLAAVAEALRSTADRAAALREHHDRLLTERDRLDRLARTVAATLDALEEGSTMSADDLYAGFDHRQYEQEARERWGDPAVDRSTARWETMSEDQRRDHLAEGEALNRALADLMTAGVAPGDPATRDAVARHHRWVSLFWTPDAEAYRSLGSMYADDPRFAATYDAVAPGLAAYLRDAIDTHAAAVTGS
ncbi:MerR family transcriptional regulator [Cellulomonas denverensis]|uniref:MerR family transcriptional regulator n=2 Tax=Cellulomonas denverensis TaxID=264297 RepID=A0A7X6KXQ5_9CELL|nr:MerR family transcriptional regulator [Cellulomonas denverensis]GIG25297.1 MerR family transcriptional regulator [Cellulomonas denverensis]